MRKRIEPDSSEQGSIDRPVRMACTIHAHLLLNAFALLISFGAAVSGLRVDLIHRDSLDGSITNNNNKNMALARAVERSRSRQREIQTIISQKDAQTVVRPAAGDYFMKLAVGTPPVSFEAFLDTGSDLIWTPSTACNDNNSNNTSSCLETPTLALLAEDAGAVFDPSRSSTYAKVPCGNPLCVRLGDLRTCTPDCEYAYGYGDAPPARGILSFDTLTIGDGFRVAHVAFGAGYQAAGQGTAGLGRGPLSLISQLGSRVRSKFSYCLTDAASTKPSPLIFGESAAAGFDSPGVPYAANNGTTDGGTMYYLPLEGISVGGSPVSIPDGTFDVKPGGDGGVVIDSGTRLAILDDAAYGPVKEAFRSLIPLRPAAPQLSNPELCYDVPRDGSLPELPSLVFHFRGGVDWAFPAENYFVPDAGYNYFCLAMLGVSDNSEFGGGPSIIGSLLQQNFHVLYDNGNNSLSFRQFPCNIL